MGCPCLFWRENTLCYNQVTGVYGKMLWDVIKQSAGDIWEEMLFVITFNIIWLLGSLLIIPWPFVTFGLFAIVYDIGQGKGIKFTRFFSYAHQSWKQAYIWGGINLGVLLILWINIRYYGSIEAQWAAILQMFMAALAFAWIALQLVALPLYPRLEEPGFKLALRNAAILASHYPMAVLALVIIAALILALSSFLPAIAFLGAFAIIAIIANRLVGALVAKMMKHQEP